ncbi:MAG: hypothetical protein K6D95_01380 [Treponema sp.]|nr:hypothetical protein [Treponema sp.]
MTFKQQLDYIRSKDYPLNKFTRLAGLCGTGIFWLILLIILAVLPAASNKPKYKVVQIMLSAPTSKKQSQPAQTKAEPAQEKTQAAPAETQAKQAPEAEKSAAKKTPAKTQPAPAKPAPAKNAPSKPAPAPAKPKSQPVKEAAPVEYARDMSDGVDFNKPVEKKRTNADDVWAMFEAETSSSEDNQTVNKVLSENTFSGSAGQVDNSSGGAKSTESRSGKTSAASSSATNKTLQSIEGTHGSEISKVEKQGASVSHAQVNSGDFTWAEGKVRNLWYPASPEIKFAEGNEPSMNMEVKIHFTVTPNGNVVSIDFPGKVSLLTASQREEVKRQISKWQFDSADYQSEADFILKIVIK